MPLGIDEVGEALAVVEAPWLLAGAAVIALVASPKARQSARSLLVKAAAATLAGAELAKQKVAQMGEGWQDMVADARADYESARSEPPGPAAKPPST